MDNFPSPSMFSCGITEPPQVTSGNSKQISTGEKTLTPKCLPLISVHLFTHVCLGFHHSASSLSLPPPSAGFSFFCSVVQFPQFFQLFECILWIVAGKNNAYSCAGCGIADWLPSCRNSASFFLIEPGVRLNRTVTQRLIWNQPKHEWCHFSMAVRLSSHYLCQNDIKQFDGHDESKKWLK